MLCWKIFVTTSFQRTFQKFFHMQKEWVYSTCMYHIHACTQDKNFHFHKIVPFWWKHLVSFFSRWFPEVQVMFYEGNKRKQVPSNQDPEKLESFFNCAATLMTDNLQQLTLNSLDDYSDLLCQPPVRPITKLYKSFLIKFLLLYVSVENSFLY